MAYAAANPEEPTLRGYLVYSIVFHAVLSVVVLSASFFERRGNAWAGVGGQLGGTKVNLVTAAGIPMPREPVVTDSKAVDPTKSLYKEEPPKPKPPEPKTDATKIPKFEKEKPLPPSPKSRVFESKAPIPDNAIRKGEGGNPDLPTSYSQVPGGGSEGVSIKGEGGGDFASRYGWYIEAVKNRIYSNWQQWTIDAAGRASRTIHCSVTFTINRDGSIKDIRISESSGNSTYDYAARRAVENSNPVAKLPGDYSGSYVVATLDFNPPSIR